MTKRNYLKALRGGPMAILGVSTVFTVGTIVYSHYAQVRDKAEMRAGVERDKILLREKRRRDAQ
jgi:hypothetical protein